MMPQTATAFAPATVANVGSGFDILGFAIDGIGDRVTVTRTKEAGVVIAQMRGTLDVSAIPTEAHRNTAGVALLKMLEAANPGFGFSLQVEKGIPLGSGMGGSAASAVGAVVAANALLSEGFSQSDLLNFALEGESVASGAKHADNVAPCLYGGLTLTAAGDRPEVLKLPFPKELLAVVVYPALRLDTKIARAALSTEVSLKMHTAQSSRLAALIAGTCLGDLKLIRRGLEDVLIEPQRASLIPGFSQVKQAALDAGVLGASISGAGPSVFALAADRDTAERARRTMIEAFSRHGGLSARGWISPIFSKGAHLL